ncbi:hypothetical protein [Lipingzhangella rawalii]|nr:hypothetical protein [Lipingzhangella rawalii]
MTLPGASELFRSTGPSTSSASQGDPAATSAVPAAPAAQQAGAGSSSSASSEGGPPKRRRATGKPSGAPRPSGRQRHDEKITVYVSAGELLALEQARLSLRADHGLVCDRGRIVREAVAALLADYDEHGEQSLLARRLAEEESTGR